MKTETLQIKYSAEKLATLRLYLKKAQIDLDSELEKCIDKLCDKHLPKDVRELFEMLRQEQAVKAPRPPQPGPPMRQHPDSDRRTQE